MPQSDRHYEKQWVTATQVAAYVYCPESWRLAELKKPITDIEQTSRGEIEHAQWQVIERKTSYQIRLGLILLRIALLISLLKIIF